MSIVLSVITRRLSLANFHLVRKGDRLLVGTVPSTVLQRPIHGKWILIQEDPEVKKVEKSRDEILGDILSKKTTYRRKEWKAFDQPEPRRKGDIVVRREIAKVEVTPEDSFVTVARKPKKVFLCAMKRDLELERKNRALAEIKTELKGVREGYEFIHDPKVTAAQMEKDLKAKRNMKRMFLRRRAKLATV